MERRTDRVTALYVDAVLNLCQAEHPASAIVILLDHGLSLETVLRIVDRPSERRQHTCSAPEAATTVRAGSQVEQKSSHDASFSIC